jgi:hypothetical protein
MTVVVTDPLPSVAVHDTGVPPVSLETVEEGQPAVLQRTVTAALCQAEQSAGPGEHDGTGCGGSAWAAEPASVTQASAAAVSTSRAVPRLMCAT